QVPGLSIDGVDGRYNGGFIATDSGFLDGTQLKDRNDALVDIGRYLSVTVTPIIVGNGSRPGAYLTSSGSTYAGLYSSLGVTSAPTNKLVKGVRLPFAVNKKKLDMLAGRGYVALQDKPRGIVVVDAPTAARPESDYQRLSTVRQVKAAVDSI